MTDLYLDDAKKFHNAETQFLVRDNNQIYFRIVQFDGVFSLKTATASEGTKWPVCPDQAALLNESRVVFEAEGWPSKPLDDKSGRPFLSWDFKGGALDALEDHNTPPIKPLARAITIVVERLLNEDKAAKMIAEMRNLHDDLKGAGSAEKVYLGDGLFLTAEGDLLE